jgi:hypothetical protein
MLMSITPKNWSTFQHYKDRKPAWIKLHRGLLDDFAFASLPLASQALAPRLWLIASEYADGKITASLDEIAFRVRCSKCDIIDALKPLILSGFFIDDSGALADCKQSSIPEKEEETQEQTEEEEDISSLRAECESDVSREKTVTVESPLPRQPPKPPPDDDWPSDYAERFWKQYPRRVGRKKTFAILKSIRARGEVTFAVLMAGVARIPINEPKFIPHPTTWLNQGRWDDEVLPAGGPNAATSSFTDRIKELADRARQFEREGDYRGPPVAVGSG